MSLDDRRLGRLRSAFRTLTDRAGPDCPDIETLWDAAHGGLPPDLTREAVLHSSGCPACAEAWRLAWALDPEVAGEPLEIRSRTEEVARDDALRQFYEDELEGPRTPTPPEPPRRPAESLPPAVRQTPTAAARRTRDPGLAWGLAQTVFVVAVSIGLVVLFVPREVHGWIEPPRPWMHEPLDRTNAVLRWSDGPPGARWNVGVVGPDLERILAVRDLEEPYLEIPRDHLEDVPPGAPVLWQIDMVLPNGQVRRSRPVTTRLR